MLESLDGELNDDGGGDGAVHDNSLGAISLVALCFQVCLSKTSMVELCETIIVATTQPTMGGDTSPRLLLGSRP